MLARYYVYEQHMGEGKSARKPRTGIRRLEVAGKNREKQDQGTVWKKTE